MLGRTKGRMDGRRGQMGGKDGMMNRWTEGSTDGMRTNGRMEERSVKEV